MVASLILTNCQSKYERFKAEAPRTDRVVIYFYEDADAQKDYQGLKVTATNSERIREIAEYVTGRTKKESTCSPVGHMQFVDAANKVVFDLPFCFTEEAAYLLFSSNEYRPLSDSGTTFLREHYRTFEQVRGR
jgi:hypothetical protein